MNIDKMGEEAYYGSNMSAENTISNIIYIAGTRIESPMVTKTRVYKSPERSTGYYEVVPAIQWFRQEESIDCKPQFYFPLEENEVTGLLLSEPDRFRVVYIGNLEGMFDIANKKNLSLAVRTWRNTDLGLLLRPGAERYGEDRCFSTVVELISLHDRNFGGFITPLPFMMTSDEIDRVLEEHSRSSERFYITKSN